ncbi:zinc-dependent alcohol dehydrogenase [Microbacterium rhizosphaerae]|uniref:Zinc-binding dehydrogenase n=1 Tax=Microbacterium rhizosphaerae TaxID=1678237 RepID=A0ABZ0SM35_9MICO|nr:zinc-binding dehydrogenase [Microbacterium rhizosphaerae]WPR89331.1 zinc-binding dehydrogenase [Microbacterium rhizosphaerae]
MSEPVGAAMRALRWHARGDLRVETVPTPRPRAGEALIRVERVGLCGTDVEEYRTGPHDIPVDAPHPVSGAMAPMIPGHEVVGVVVACADRPDLVGRRVIPDVVDGCGDCWWCRHHEEGLCPRLVVRGQTGDGGLAEFMLCRSRTMVPVPPDVPGDVAAFAEPVAVATRAVAKAGDLRGRVAAVVGTGVVGNLIAQVCISEGATVVAIDPAAHRRALAAEVGAVAASPDDGPAEVGRVSGGRGADVVFECAGRPDSFDAGFRLARRGGSIILVGINDSGPAFPWRQAVLHELRILGTAAHMWDTDVTAAVHALADGTVQVGALLSKTIALEEVPAMLHTLSEPNTLAKVLVDPGATSALRSEDKEGR